MKKTVFILILAAVFSCKKDSPADIKSEEDTDPFKKQLTEMHLNTGVKRNFAYNAAGRITSGIGNFTTTTYEQGAAFSLKHTYKNNGDVYELKSTARNALGKITAADRYYNGTLQSKIQYQYNEEGFLVKMSTQRMDINYKSEMSYEYENGNMVKVINSKEGIPNDIYLYEYDLQAANPFKLDWFELMQTGFITDEQFGKFSRNLLKKEVLQDKNGQAFRETHFKFTRDAAGYPLALEAVTPNFTTKYSFTFE